MKALTTRRLTLSAAALALLAAAAPRPAAAADAAAAAAYPTKPVSLIVPAAPGGTTDFTARLLAEGLTRELGKQFVVENKGGASGNIGTGLVARATPDGYTLLLNYSGYHVTNPALFKKLDWDPVKSFAPVALAIKAPHVVAVRKDLPANTLTELVTYAKANPGKLNYGTPGIGSIPHIGTEQLQQLTGTEFVHVPYKGTGPAMTDLLGGTIDISVTTPPSAAGHLQSGAIKGLALAASRRHAMMPDVPTAAEAGVQGFELEAWFGLFAPAGIPQPIVDKLAAAVEKLVASEDVQRRAQEQGTYAVYLGPKEFGEFVGTELTYWGDTIRKAGITLE